MLAKTCVSLWVANTSLLNEFEVVDNNVAEVSSFTLG